MREQLDSGGSLFIVLVHTPIHAGTVGLSTRIQILYVKGWPDVILVETLRPINLAVL